MLDRCYQLAYRAAYQGMRLYWRIRRPDTHGALVALWCENRILLVRNSYVEYYSLPGGYVKPGESGIQAARRELLEEIALSVDESQLIPVLDLTSEWEGKNDRVEVFQLDVEAEPRVKVDNREVISAGLFTATDALKLNLFPTLRRHIEERIQLEPRLTEA